MFFSEQEVNLILPNRISQIINGISIILLDKIDSNLDL